MQILALDPGTRTGFAFRDASGHLEAGTQGFKLCRGESSGFRFIRFNTWLRTLPIERGDLVIYELAHHRGGDATVLLVGMATRIEEFAEERGAASKGVPSGTLKKAVAGKGNAEKHEMIRAVVKFFAPRLDDLFNSGELDEHAADAAGLLAWYDLGMPEGAGRKRKAKQEVQP